MNGDMKEYRYGREFFELKVPLVQRCFIFILLAILVGAFAWAYFGSIDIVVKAEAVLRPSANISTVKNSVPGKMIAKRFLNGQAVKRGDVLWTIDDKAVRVEQGILEEQRTRGTRKLQSLRLVENAFLSGINCVPESDADAYARAGAYFSERTRLQLSSNKTSMDLDREKTLPANMRQPQKVKELELDSGISKAASDSFEAQEKLKLKSEIEALESQNEELQKRLADIALELSQMSITAPLDGVVDELQKTNEDDYLFAGEEVVRIIPGGNEELKAQINVDSRDIARIVEGMQVNLRFTSLPPSEYGQLSGRITKVPADSTTVSNMPALFVLEASLPSKSLSSRKGEVVVLKSGMVAEARILIERKRVLRYLLEKLDFLS
jgi:Multidrug resistance efflux pump